MLPTGILGGARGRPGLVAAGRARPPRGQQPADWIGPALITLGVLSAVSFYYVTRKVIAAHRDEPVRTGTEEMIGSSAEARTTIDPEGQVWTQGALWGARLANGAGPARPGDRVTVEAVDGLTLVVRPGPDPQSSRGRSKLDGSTDRSRGRPGDSSR